MSFAVSASSYDRFMGRYSVRLAPQFAEFAGVSGGQRMLCAFAGLGFAGTGLPPRESSGRAASNTPLLASLLRWPAIEGCGGHLFATKHLVEQLTEEDADGLGIDADRLVYTMIADLADAPEKSRRDAGGVPVVEVFPAGVGTA